VLTPPRIKWAFVVVALSGLLYASLQIKHLVDNSSLLSGNAQIKAVPYTEPTKAAVAQKLEGAKGMFQITMLVMAVLWGLLIAKKDERALFFSGSHRQEVFLFITANLLFLASAYCYSGYTDAMSSVHVQGQVELEDPKDITIMDFNDPRINGFYVWQMRIWVTAMVVTGLALASAYGFRSPEQEAAKCDSPKQLL